MNIELGTAIMLLINVLFFMAIILVIIRFVSRQKANTKKLEEISQKLDEITHNKK